MGAFLTRQLVHTELDYVDLVATYVHVRTTTSLVVTMAVVVATGITDNGDREILGCEIGDSGDEALRSGFLSLLGARGLGGVRLVTSDQHTGLAAALTKSFQKASHQRCQVNFARNWSSLVPRSHTDIGPAVVRTFLARPDADACRRGGIRSATSWRRFFPRSAR